MKDEIITVQDEDGEWVIDEDEDDSELLDAMIEKIISPKSEGGPKDIEPPETDKE